MRFEGKSALERGEGFLDAGELVLQVGELRLHILDDLRRGAADELLVVEFRLGGLDPAGELGFLLRELLAFGEIGRAHV